MINLFDKVRCLDIISIKLKVPQVGSFVLDYTDLSTIPDDVIYDFIIDINGNLLIGKGHYKLNNKKSTLYFAGRLKIKGGLIYYVDNDSGHYAPSDQQTLIIKDILINRVF